MPTEIHCPNCGQVYGLTDAQVPQYAGQTITCTQCQKPFTVSRDLGSKPGGAPPPAPVVAPSYPQQPQYSQQVQYQTPQYQQQQSNPMAIVAIVCGALGFIVPVIPSLLGVLFGILGLRRTRNPAVGGKALAITGLSLGAASFFMSGCLIAILLPSLNRARETANRVKCASNMRTIGQALLLYSNDNRGAFPPRLEDLIISGHVDSSVFVCPSCMDSAAPGATPQAQAQNLSAGGHLSYVYIGQRMNSSAPADAVVLYENVTNHDGDGCNMLHGDGHIDFISKPQMQQIITQLQAGKNPPNWTTSGRAQ
jgi:predicted Zn finger-like uncharacterized protein